mgnify:CR=1 FL=1
MVHGRLSDYNLAYEITWCTRTALTTADKNLITKVIQSVAFDMKVDVCKISIDFETVDLIVKAPPTLSVVVIVKKLKGVTARQITSRGTLENDVDTPLFKRGYTAKSINLSEEQ